MRKVALVTGCNGFIGSALCKYLDEQGWGIVGVDITKRQLSYGGFVQKDARDLKRSDLYDLKIAAVFHCACYAEPVKYKEDPLFILNSCYEGTSNVIQIATALKAKFIYLSTVDVTNSHNTEDCKVAYVAGKLAAEAICQSYKDLIPIKIARLNNVYGNFKDTDTRVIPTFIKAVKANNPIVITEDSNRNFCYVGDVVEALVDLYNDDSETVLHQFNGETTSISNLATIVEKVVNMKTNLEHGLVQTI